MRPLWGRETRSPSTAAGVLSPNAGSRGTGRSRQGRGGPTGGGRHSWDRRSFGSQASQVVTGLGQQLLASAKNQTDGVLSSITTDLGGKLGVLGQSLTQTPAVKQQLDGAVKSLLAGQEVEALGAYAKMADAKPTAEQAKLLKEVKDLTAAYVVQKNFATLSGSEGDVAQIVSSFRKGEAMSALPAIQKVSQNAQLTSAQKELLSSVADKFAPGAKKAGEALQQGLKGLKALGN